MLFLDPHVHIYPCYDLERFLNSAFKNFRLLNLDTSTSFGIILTERFDCHYFDELSNKDAIGSYSIIHHTNHIEIHKGENHLHIFRGQQVNTRERIEILSLFSRTEIEERSHTLEHVVDTILSKEGIPVINWAPGKWLGKRGKIIEDFLTHAQKEVLLGCSPLLPKGAPYPRIIRRHPKYPVIWGSDPLPFKGEEARAGTCGILLDCKADDHLLFSLVKQGEFAVIDKKSAFPSVFFRLLANELSRRNLVAT